MSINFLRIMWNGIGVINIIMYTTIISGIFKNGTIEAGGLYWLVLIVLIVPSSIIYVTIYYIRKAKKIQSNRFEVALNYLNIALAISSISLYKYELETKYFWNVGLENYRK